MRAIFEQDKQQLFGQAAQEIFDKITSLPSRPVVLAVCGGRSIVGLLEAMARQPQGMPESDWRRLQWFMVDERLVPLDHEDSNYRLVHELFFSDAVERGLLLEEQLHPFRCRPELPDCGASEYEAELAEYGGSFDIACLGAGEDGHVAGMFPGGPWLEQPEKQFIVFDNSPKPPAERMTCTPALLRRSGLVLGLFVGEGKRDALDRFHRKDLTIAECPAKILLDVPESLLISDLT